MTLKRKTENFLYTDRATDTSDHAKDGLQHGREGAVTDDREAVLNDAKEARKKATGDAGKEEAYFSDKTEDNLENHGKLAM